jgi:hypothetical protein
MHLRSGRQRTIRGVAAVAIPVQIRDGVVVAHERKKE